MNKLIETLAALNLSSATTKITRLEDRYEFTTTVITSTMYTIIAG